MICRRRHPGTAPHTDIQFHSARDVAPRLCGTDSDMEFVFFVNCGVSVDVNEIGKAYYPKKQNPNPNTL
jgi:hypothetical protein